MRAYDLEVTGSLKVQGDIKAENYIVETTVTSMTQSFASGSSKFGDGVLDSHQFTGSLLVTGSNLTIDSAGTVSGSSSSTGSFGALTLGSGKYLGSLATTGGLTVDGTIYLGNNGGIISNLSAGYSMTLQSGNKHIFKSWQGGVGYTTTSSY